MGTKNPPLSTKDIKCFGPDPLPASAPIWRRLKSASRLLAHRPGATEPPCAADHQDGAGPNPAICLRRRHQHLRREQDPGAISKREALDDLAIDWSIVGHLQTNKAKYLTRFAREFHALHSLRLPDILNTRLEREDRFLNVYVQVNTSGEDSKFGLHPNALLPFVEKVDQGPRLRPCGFFRKSRCEPVRIDEAYLKIRATGALFTRSSKSDTLSGLSRLRQWRMA
ncbi:MULTISPECIES: hypothetical protein [Mesorhizobium]|uniref:hypothetical protein n=1 Tax=Mesorhizobium TaxID=68287 RepID=UPI001FD8D624|nr:MULTISPECIES: hypothetical protein [Mesorhizobium]